MVEEVNKVLEEASVVLIAYDVFNPENDQRKSMLYCEEQFLKFLTNTMETQCTQIA